ncbi:MAG TPA: hypothetical protein PLO53_01600 [Candidatus Hydrogenedentes bacterium]|nr:hypothetical protein [Candidatus Hydrogenedentota bacterium]
MSDASSAKIETDPPAAPPAFFSPPGVFIRRGLQCMVVAAMVLAMCGEVERRWLAGRPWSRAAVLVNVPEDARSANSISVKILRLSPETLAAAARPAEAALLSRSDFSADEDLRPSLEPPWLIVLEAAPETLAPFIESGRVPDPGRPELLAGELIAPACSAVDIQGMHYDVTGRLQSGIPAFSWAFVAVSGIGTAPLLEGAPEVWAGWLDPTGLDRLDSFQASLEEPPGVSDGSAEEKETGTEAPQLRSWNGDENPDGRPSDVPESGQPEALSEGGEGSGEAFWIADPCRTRPGITGSALAALFLSFLGGALLQWGIIRSMFGRSRPDHFFYAFLRDAIRHARLWKWLHAVYYGWVLLCMLAAVALPVISLFLLGAVQEVFSEGSLAYVGAAYESGNILHAAWATFYNNYIVQTVRNTILLSIFGIPVGVFLVFSTLFPTALVMSPVWTQTVSGYALHSVTMALELQAYLLAVFAVLCWSRRVFFFIMRPGRLTSVELIFGVKSLAGAILFIGAQLALAALYESITLLIFISG